MVRSNANVDGGYAWVVLVSLFTVDLLIGMLWTTVGLLTTAIVQEMEEDITKASVVGSTLLGTSTLFGPVSGLLHDRLGHRWTGVVSGVLMLVGLASASVCTSVTGLICTFGFITGLGASLGTNLSGVVPGSYFKKKLFIAYGITQVGGGCGLFLVGPLTLFLLDRYQLSGTVLILGAIMFHVSLAGALIRPNTVLDDEEKPVDIESNSCPVDADVEARDDSTYVMSVGDGDDSSEAQAGYSPGPDDGDFDSLADVDETSRRGEENLDQAKASETFLTEVLDDEYVVPVGQPRAENDANSSALQCKIKRSCMSLQELAVISDIQNHNGLVPVAGEDSVVVCKTFANPTVGVFSECVSDYSATITNSPKSQRNQKSPVKYVEGANQNDQAASEPLMGNNPSRDHRSCSRRLSRLTFSQLKTIFLVLRSNGFYIYLISSVFWTLGDSSSMLHLPNYAESRGTNPSQISNLLTGMGVTVIISSVLSGFAVSDPIIGNILLNFGCLGMAGILTVLFPLYSNSYFLQMLYGALYCVYSQAPYTLAGPICIQLVGVTNLGLGYGLSAFFTGLGYLFGPPIASLLYESSGVYDLSYVFAGCCLLVAALLIALVPMFEKRKVEMETPEDE